MTIAFAIIAAIIIIAATASLLVLVKYASTVTVTYLGSGIAAVIACGGLFALLRRLTRSEQRRAERWLKADSPSGE